MKTLIVYDSKQGNTEQVAKAVGAAISGDVKVTRVANAAASEVKGCSLLIVASPTLGGKPTPEIESFVAHIPHADLKGVRVASFDTRISMGFAKIFGYAAIKIDAALTKAGGTQAAAPEGFFVKKSSGPLKDNELQRAAEWARTLGGS